MLAERVEREAAVESILDGYQRHLEDLEKNIA